MYIFQDMHHVGKLLIFQNQSKIAPTPIVTILPLVSYTVLRKEEEVRLTQ